MFVVIISAEQTRVTAHGGIAMARIAVEDQINVVLREAAHQPIALIIGVGAVGAGIARVLIRSQLNYHLVLAGRTDIRSSALKAELEAAGYTGRVSTLVFNAGNRKQCEMLSGAFATAGRRIGVLVLAAGEAILDAADDTLGGRARDTNINANYHTKIRPLRALAQQAAGVVVVSSIVKDFADDDPRLQRQWGYRSATRTLVREVQRLGPTYWHWVVWDCPLVQGDTADLYKHCGIVPADMVVQRAEDAVRASLLPRLISAGMYN